MKNTIVVNLLGGPGVGKSTLTAAIFAKLKDNDVDCEMASEFAKELVWEQRNETFKDELYIFAKQAHRLFRLNGKVDVIITDRPLILTCFYAQDDKPLCKFCLDRFESYHNVNYLLVREKAYNPNGRNQNEEEARKIDTETKVMLAKYDIDYKELPGNMDTSDIIVNDILKMLGKEPKSVGQPTSVPPTPYWPFGYDPTKDINIYPSKTNPCEGCPNHGGPKDAFGNPVVGDSPCTWCPHYPFRVTYTTNEIKKDK